MGWRPLSDPAELERLGAEELFLRLRPLLYTGGLAADPVRLARLRPNLPSVCAELAAAWRRSPVLAGRRVGFGDYLAARLCSRQHELDREQYPELYDEHRRYRPERAPLPLDEATPARQRSETTRWPAVEPAAEHVRALGTPWPRPLRAAMRSQGIAAASQAAFLETMASLERGEIGSPYRFTRSLGYSSREAHNRPATSGYLLALDLIAPAPAVASAR